MTVKICAAQLQDAAQICAILCRSISELCVADHKNNPLILSAWLANKTEENLCVWIVREEQTYRIAIIDGKIADVGAVSLTDGILLNYVAPDYQYCGVSKAIMAALELWLMQHGQKRSHLNSTVTAYSFYEKIGYVADGGTIKGRTGLLSFPMMKILR